MYGIDCSRSAVVVFAFRFVWRYVDAGLALGAAHILHGGALVLWAFQVWAGCQVARRWCCLGGIDGYGGVFKVNVNSAVVCVGVVDSVLRQGCESAWVLTVGLGKARRC